MIKKIVKYEDFNGEEQTEELYFHLNKAEVTAMNFKAGDIQQRLKMLLATGRRGAIIEWFEEIIIKSYGIKSEDGTQFIKSQEAIDRFKYSNAFSELFLDLVSNPTNAEEFIAGVIGKSAKDLKEVQAIKPVN